MNLQELMNLVAQNWSFDEKSYPELQECSDKKRIVKFAVQHILQHQVKALGQLAETTESWDHGLEEKNINLRIATRKLFKNTLRLAEILGLSAHDLLSACIKE